MTREIRKQPFSSGLFVVRGQQGVGKTSFCTGLLRADYKRWAKWRCQEGKRLASEYYQDNGIELTISDRLYFSSIKILLNKRKKLYTHYVDVHRLGLPNPDYKVQYLPRGSVVFIQEADVLLFCRDYESLNEYFINLLKYVRHNLLTIIFDCQVDSMFDKVVRRLTMGIYHIVDSYDTRFFLFWNKRKWKFIYIQNQLNEAVKELASVGVKLNVSIVERGKFSCIGNVFQFYNSFSGVPYFLWGIEKVGYEYLSYPKESLRIDDVENFVKVHPLIRPKEIRKKKRKGEDEKTTLSLKGQSALKKRG